MGISVVNITATDPDEDEGGTIHFEIIDEGEANGRIQVLITIIIFQNIDMESVT